MDGVTHHLVQAFAKLGTCGRWTSNVERDFWRLVDRHLPLELDPYIEEVPFVSPSGLGVQTRKQAFLLPHEVFAFLAENYADDLLFNSNLGVKGVTEFWDIAYSQPWFEAHPHRGKVVENSGRCIPIRLHGDDCKGIDCLSWTSTQVRAFTRNPFTCYTTDDATADAHEQVFDV